MGNLDKVSKKDLLPWYKILLLPEKKPSFVIIISVRPIFDLLSEGGGVSFRRVPSKIGIGLTKMRTEFYGTISIPSPPKLQKYFWRTLTKNYDFHRLPNPLGKKFLQFSAFIFFEIEP